LTISRREKGEKKQGWRQKGAKNDFDEGEMTSGTHAHNNNINKKKRWVAREHALPSHETLRALSTPLSFSLSLSPHTTRGK